jgi:membrane-associated phospholipid phosphatase
MDPAKRSMSSELSASTDLESTTPGIAPSKRVHFHAALVPIAGFALVGVLTAGWIAGLLPAFDIPIYRAFNAFCGWSPKLDRILLQAAALKSALVMVVFGFLWFRRDGDVSLRRELLVTTIIAVPISLILNRALSTLVPFRDRPIYSIGGNFPSIEWRADLENWSSFPSDHATYLFAIAAGLWLVSRPWGVVFGMAATAVTLTRIFVGVHFPSDILTGALIGIATSLAVSHEPTRIRIAAPIVALESRYPSYFYAILFVTLAELSEAFQHTRHVGMAIIHLFGGHH